MYKTHSDNLCRSCYQLFLPYLLRHECAERASADDSITLCLVGHNGCLRLAPALFECTNLGILSESSDRSGCINSIYQPILYRNCLHPVKTETTSHTEHPPFSVKKKKKKQNPQSMSIGFGPSLTIFTSCLIASYKKQGLINSIFQSDWSLYINFFSCFFITIALCIPASQFHQFININVPLLLPYLLLE